MGFLVIDYETLILVVVFAFAAIGFSRGWLTESINTALLALLSILMFKPEMLEPILAKINEILKLLWAILDSGFDLAEAFILFKDMDDIVDPSNPYPVLLIVTIALLAFQYAGTRIRLTGELTAFSRILGAVLGAVNGNIVVSLAKQLILGHTEVQLARATGKVAIDAKAAAAIQTQAETARRLAPSGISLAVENVPREFLPESAWIWIAGAALVIIVVLVMSRFTEKPIGNR